MRSLKKNKKIIYVLLAIISVVLIINLGYFIINKYNDSLKPKNRIEKKLEKVKDEDITDLLITIADTNDYKTCYNNSLHNYLLRRSNYDTNDAYNMVLKYALNNKSLTSDFKIKKSNLEKIFNYYSFNFSFNAFIDYLKTNNLVIESEKDYTFNYVNDDNCADSAYHDINFWYGNYDDVKSNKKSNLITMKDVVFLNDDTTEIYYFVFEKNNNSYKLKDIIKHFN